MATSTVTPDQNPSAGPLTIQQGPLLPMPVEQPVQVATGYTNTPDGLDTHSLADVAAEQPRPETNPPVVAIPGIGNVAFPAFMSMDAIQTASKRLYEQAANSAAGRF